MSDDFEVKKREGILAVRWGDFQGLVIPAKVIEEMKVGGGAGASPGGANLSAEYGKAKASESVIIVKVSGSIMPLEVWARKTEIEAGLAKSGIAASVSGVMLASEVEGTAGIDMRAAVAPDARTERWKCEICGETIEPMVSHRHA